MNTVIFDLDGTLLSIDHDAFINGYFKELVKKIAPEGFDPGMLAESIKAGTTAMIQNDGSMRNEERFWGTFALFHGKEAGNLVDKFLHFYQNDFQKFSCYAKPDPLVKQITDELKNKGYDLLMATNTLFPLVATATRIRWAGINPEIFSYISTYENSSFSKPKIEYYKEILAKTNKDAAECLMVGNGIEDDMIISKLGSQTFLITDSVDPAVLEHQYVTLAGTRQDLFEYVKKLPAIK